MDLTNTAVANQTVEDIYRALEPMALKTVAAYSKDVDTLIQTINKAPTLTNEELRVYILRLSIESYKLAVYKDTSALKNACSKAILQEKQAIAFNEAEGTVAAKQNTTTIQTSDNIVVNMLYNTVSDLLKTKLDETHRIINALNNILISRQADAKLEATQPVPQPQQPTRVILNEGGTNGF